MEVELVTLVRMPSFRNFQERCLAAGCHCAKMRRYFRLGKKLKGTWMNFGHRNRRIIVGNPRRR
jgi:hypothetical protein